MPQPQAPATLQHVQLPWAPNPQAFTRLAQQSVVQPLLQPLPSIPVEDQSEIDDEQRIRLAIALDVLCSATRRITPAQNILAEAVTAWMRLRGTENPADDYADLSKLADSMVGRARALLNEGLLKTLVRAAPQQVPEASHAPTQTKPSAEALTYAALTTPDSVAKALVHVEKAGHLLVQETILWLASRNQIHFKRG